MYPPFPRLQPLRETVSTLCVGRARLAFVCVHKKTKFTQRQSCLSRRLKRTPNLSSRSSGGTCESRWGKRKSGTTETPADTRVLSQVYYIRQRRSFIATGQRSHSFPLSAASSGMCGCVRDRAAAISPAPPSCGLSPCSVPRWGSARSRFAHGRLQASYPLPWVLIAITDSLNGAKESDGAGRRM